MKVSENSKYQTYKKSIKLTKNPNDQTGTLLDFLTTIVAKHQKFENNYSTQLKFNINLSPAAVNQPDKRIVA